MKRNFNSSISIIKITPNRGGSYFNDNLIKNNINRNISSKINNIGANPSFPNTIKSGVIKIIKDNKYNKNALMNNGLSRSPDQLKSISDFVGSY